MTRLSKSTNLDLYPAFFPYGREADIPYEGLARVYNCSANKFRALKSSATRYETIYLELLNMGYGDDDIPDWFMRPEYARRPHKNKPKRSPIIVEEPPLVLTQVEEMPSTVSAPAPPASAPAPPASAPLLFIWKRT